MSVNYASKYVSVVDERFKLAAQTESAVNRDFEWSGVESIILTQVPTAPMNNYQRSGTNRYGEPEELENSVQELKLRRDRSFTFTIDRASHDDTQMTMAAGQALARQIEEEVIPEIDIYRLAIMAANALPELTGTGEIKATTAYGHFVDADAALTDAKVPLVGRQAFVTPTFYKFLKQDKGFILPSEMAQDMLTKGVIGQVDGTVIKRVPTSYLAAGVEFVITHSSATTAAQKLADYKIHDNPPGINGWLVEGRIRYDAFVLEAKRRAIYVHNKA